MKRTIIQTSPGDSYLVEKCLRKALRDCRQKSQYGRRVASMRRSHVYAMQAQSIISFLRRSNNKPITIIMKQTNMKISGTVFQRVNNNYIIDLDNGDRVNISVNAMNQSVDLNALTINGTIPNGTRMNFFIGKNGVYPDKDTYPLKETIQVQYNKQDANLSSDPHKLLKGIKPYQQPCTDRETFMLELTPMFATMKAETMKKVFIILDSSLSENDKQSLIRNMLKMPVRIQAEGVNFERKSSFLHTPNDTTSSSCKKQQIRDIADELLSIANSGHKGTVVVGVDDKTGEVKGLEKEIAEAYPEMNVNQFQDTVVCNVFRSYVNDNTIMNSLSFDWRCLNGHLVCFITIDYAAGRLACLPDGSVPYRTDSSMTTAHGKDATLFAFDLGVAYGRQIAQTA